MPTQNPAVSGSPGSPCTAVITGTDHCPKTHVERFPAGRPNEDVSTTIPPQLAGLKSLPFLANGFRLPSTLSLESFALMYLGFFSRNLSQCLNNSGSFPWSGRLGNPCFFKALAEAVAGSMFLGMAS